MRPDVWIPERTPVEERKRLDGLASIHVFPDEGPLPSHDGGADLLVAGHDSRRAIEVAGELKGLRYIQVFSAGVDSVLDRVPPGVVLCDAAGVHDVAVAEWVVMVILAALHRLPERLDAQRTSRWRRDKLIGDDLVDATVVILGAGSIGGAVEARLAPFGANVVRVARRPRAGVHAMADLPEILPAADVVIVLLPLTDQTHGIVDAGVLAAMRPGALLVNASRGAVVDTVALTDAVLAGRIRAALDVTDPEPLPDGHPLWSAPGVIVTPHVASDVRREDERAWRLVFEQVGRLARDEPLANVVRDGY